MEFSSSSASIRQATLRVNAITGHELRGRCRSLLVDNKAIREENEILIAQLEITVPSQQIPPQVSEEKSTLDSASPVPPQMISFPTDPAAKICLFMSLFKGREDVYAKRWRNRQGRAGYAPVCRNEWKAGLCRKAAIKCLDCPHQSYDPLNDKVIEAHLRGNIVAGLYPLCRDETCHQLAIDFDNGGWEKDCAVLAVKQQTGNLNEKARLQNVIIDVISRYSSIFLLYFIANNAINQQQLFFVPFDNERCVNFFVL